MTKIKYIFWIAATLVGYSYLGYPVWLWLRSRWSPRPVRRNSAATPAVSAVMVVRNEESVIARKLDNLLTLDYPREKLEVVVVSDGSSDRTAAILAEYAGDPVLPTEVLGEVSGEVSADERTVPRTGVRTLLKPLSQGKAAGLNDAIKLASGDVLLFTDARQSIESGALRLLIENFADPEVGAASGELMLGDPSSGETGQGMGLYWQIEKRIR
jgi:biofilm PGA synthesis N-glycosyltransferase PgaC